MVPSCHSMQFKGELTNQILENGEKTNFEPDFGLFSPNSDPQLFLGAFYLSQMLGIVASYDCLQFQRKLMTQTQENDENPHFGPDLDPLPKFGLPIFFSKI